MKVALYARVSMEEGDVKDKRYQEPENQLQPLREWAKLQGYDIYHEYIDRGSGADPSRIELRKMLQEAMLLRFQTILVWKLDRLSREPMNVQIARIQELRGRGIGIKSLTESWCDTSKDNAVGDLIIAIMAWVAEQERLRISQRTKAGIARRRAIGQWKGGRPKRGGTPTEEANKPMKRNVPLIHEKV